MREAPRWAVAASLAAIDLLNGGDRGLSETTRLEVRVVKSSSAGSYAT